jgi:hypothetical protein
VSTCRMTPAIASGTGGVDGFWSAMGDAPHGVAVAAAVAAPGKSICKYPKCTSAPKTTTRNRTVSTSAFTNLLLNSMKLPAALLAPI